MIYAVVLTYGHRWAYLQEVLSQLLRFTGVKVIIVDNASDYPLKTQLSNYDVSRIQYINNAENLGSAEGYAIGMRFALQQHDCAYIWLLDDDNLPMPGCLDVIRSHFASLNDEAGGYAALMCLRPDRVYLKQVAAGGNVQKYFPRKNAFLGFSISGLISRFFPGRSVSVSVPEIIDIPCAPYGGMFFPASLLSRIGLPDARFFLYADDFEFTMRITRMGGRIGLLKDAVVQDVEQSGLGIEKKGLRVPVVIRSKDPKIFYSVRNFVYFQANNMITNRFCFGLNKGIYTGYLFILSALSGRMLLFRRFQEAVRDGLNGHFDNKKYPLQ